MVSHTYSATMVGLNPVQIEVEVDSNQGIPTLVLIGLPSQAIDEAKDRITSALRHCNIRLKSRRIVVNLAPAEVKKTSSSLELAIAVGILKMAGHFPISTDHTMFFGELSLNGELKKINGALPLVLATREMGFSHVVIPTLNSEEVSIVSGIAIHPVAHLQALIDLAKKDQPLPTLSTQPFVGDTPVNDLDFADIIGQEHAKRALTIAAAGGHNVLMVGPPGAGKSMLAKAMCSILPPLTEHEAIEVTSIYSVCGLNPQGLIRTRPFRSPHHTTSFVGLIGGGSVIRPGEISLAHHGVLFCDEFSEFSRSALEALRQPMEAGCVHISRANGNMTFPAIFSLVAAANPCACGYHGSSKKACICAPNNLLQYRKKLSGPILDRIDIRLRVQEVEVDRLTNYATAAIPPPMTSLMIRQKIAAARQLQWQRSSDTACITNAQLTNKLVKKYCRLTTEAHHLLTRATTIMKLSARSYFKTIKVAQTIADLEQEDRIQDRHISEALLFRKQEI